MGLHVLHIVVLIASLQHFFCNVWQVVVAHSGDYSVQEGRESA